MFTRLIKARSKYLENNNKTIIEETPFQEFTMQCMGEPIDLQRQSFLEGLEKIKKRKAIKYSYNPKGTPGRAPDYRFKNFTSELITK